MMILVNLEQQNLAAVNLKKKRSKNCHLCNFQPCPLIYFKRAPIAKKKNLTFLLHAYEKKVEHKKQHPSQS
ncbi:hypothetical protein BST99_02370 [Aureicoccus marinus]|uniref:Uncharacterized protein n=1 Tax=Aureicoccus marinus TaxID=754435 RepID=A0A2S7T497_9FLAO|nr:hypothetical protein BST99_02370 [Aureicoccus marinus]